MVINTIYLILTTVFTLIVFRLLLNRGDFLNLYDYPNDRKIHNKKTLKVGGIGIIFSSLFILLIYRIIFDELLFEMTIVESQILFSTIFLVIGGLIDDLITLSPWKKLFFQLTAISIIIKSGFIFSLTANSYIDVIITVIFFIIVINSMNLIDGIDGLSSGIFIIFCFSMLILLRVIPAINQQYFILVSIFLGSMIAFFIINYPPAKIFLGDAGSQLLGWSMALSIVHLSAFFETSYQRLYLLSFISIPFYDVFYVMILRFNNKRGSIIDKTLSILTPDQNHIHHSLLKNHISTNKSLLILLILFSILSLLNLIPIYLRSYHLITFIGVFLIFVFFRLFFQNRRERYE